MAYYKSLEERKLSIFEDACAGCDTDGGEPSGGEDGGEGAEVLDNPLIKALKKLKSKKKQKPVAEEMKSKPSMNMRLKASDIDMKVDKESNKEKKFKLIDRARKIRQELD